MGVSDALNASINEKYIGCQIRRSFSCRRNVSIIKSEHAALSAKHIKYFIFYKVMCLSIAWHWSSLWPGPTLVCKQKPRWKFSCRCVVKRRSAHFCNFSFMYTCIWDMQIQTLLVGMKIGGSKGQSLIHSIQNFELEKWNSMFNLKF